MTKRSRVRRYAFGVFLLAAGLATTRPAMAGPISATIFYTTFTDVNQGGVPFQVWKVDANYTGNGTAGSGVFSLLNNTGIANTNGADGIVFLPNGNLAVGGQGTGLVHEVTTAGAILGSTAANAGAGGAFHLTLDPSGSTLFATGIPGDAGALAVAGGSPSLTTPGVNHNVVGSVGALTSMAFVPGFGWYYTSSGFNFDQGTVDGQGHLYAATNNGNLLFVDYSTTLLVGSVANFSAMPFLNTNLDDVAPLIGPGSNPVPEPATLLLLGSGLATTASASQAPLD